MNDRKGQHKPKPPMPTLDVHLIKFDPINEELFSTIAEKTAETIAVEPDYSKNKPTQLRKFYEELVMWDNKMRIYPDPDSDQFKQSLPFIRMLNAKVAYAKGRNLVDDNYVKLLSHCLSNVKTVKHLHTFKLFMEAFMGFYKVKRPRD